MGEEFPDEIVLRLVKIEDFPYGENPDQPAAFYRIEGHTGGLPEWEQLYGVQPSYNNRREAGLTNRLLNGYGDRTAAAIAKHGVFAGFAFAPTIEEARKRAIECDPQADLGGVEVYTRPVSRDLAEAIRADADSEM